MLYVFAIIASAGAWKVGEGGYLPARGERSLEVSARSERVRLARQTIAESGEDIQQ
ncbi:MAG: hypothetical protein IPG04_41875 [Polyangiaceae bacterium]|nr:hypothetical protein [Polyangiaceae bacterium]